MSALRGPAPDPGSPPWHHRWSVRAAVVLAVAWAFAPCLDSGFFNLDDYENFVDNAMVHGLGWERLRWMFTSFHMTTYQPLAWLAGAAIRTALGPSPAPYHLANVALHAANAVALGMLLARILELSFPRARKTDALLAGAGAALLWAVHPVKVGGVAWITKLSDLLAAHFFLLSCLAYLRRRDLWGPQGRGGVAASAALFLASGLSRWSAISLPLALVLLDIHPLKRLDPDPRRWLSRPSRAVWLEKWPFLLIAAALLIVNAKAKSQVEGIRLLYGLAHPMDAALSTVFYLRKLLAAGDFAVLYAVNGPAYPAGMPPAMALAFVLSLTAVFTAGRRAWPLGMGAWVFWLASLTPTFAASADGTIFGQDCYCYLPSAAFALLLGEAFAALLPSIRDWRVPALLAALLAVLGGSELASRSRAQAALWRDQQALWRQTLAADPSLWIAHFNLGSLLLQAGDRDAARACFEETLRLRPGDDAWRAGFIEALRREGWVERPAGAAWGGSPRGRASRAEPALGAPRPYGEGVGGRGSPLGNPK
ncbi:MAG: tetratricopeptide repeat protein [Elusimicrobia bacterium]|nr:tetratricopeptide repeat protein [Elusimicrobiota bacterium]